MSQAWGTAQDPTPSLPPGWIVSDARTGQVEGAVDQLWVEVHPSREAMGRAAGRWAVQALQRAIAHEGQARVLFAAAPSQNELLAALAASEEIDWRRVTAFHLDEYVGLPAGAPQHFAQFLKERLFDRLPFGAVHLLDGNARSLAAECQRYASLLTEGAIHLACVGIGENGHLAFNDPPYADFADPVLVKVVELDPTSRRQQVHDGCFASLDAVPHRAITLTIPAILRAQAIACVVPGPSKTEAVRRTLWGPVDPSCPASVLRRHPRARLFLDRLAAGLQDLSAS